jgi:hypothetical protein
LEGVISLGEENNEKGRQMKEVRGKGNIQEDCESHQMITLSLVLERVLGQHL